MKVLGWTVLNKHYLMTSQNALGIYECDAWLDGGCLAGWSKYAIIYWSLIPSFCWISSLMRFASSFVATKGQKQCCSSWSRGRVCKTQRVRKTHGVRGIIIHVFATSSGNVYSTPSSQAPSYATFMSSLILLSHYEISILSWG